MEVLLILCSRDQKIDSGFTNHEPLIPYNFSVAYNAIETALQINIIPLPVTTNGKIKQPPVKLNLRGSQ